MKKIISFIKEQTTFIVIFLLYAISMITYYLVAGNNFKLFYVIFLTLFFFFLFLLIKFFTFVGFKEILRKGKNNVINEKSFLPLENDLIDTFNEMHYTYNQIITELTNKNVEDKRFISAWIHNLKTPITVADLIIQRAKAKEIPLEEALEEIKNENERLLKMLNAILDLERLDEFSKDFYPEEISLNEELTNIINDNKRLFIGAKVFPKLECDEDIIVLSDTKWNRVLINQIISNAVKYSNGANEILIQAKRNCDKVDVLIIDHGIGIPEYDIEKVFEPFFTGDNGRSGVNSSGIGLYLCKEICKNLNQDISITSKVNEGTCVKISYLTKM